jgi:hypothetical protein
MVFICFENWPSGNETKYTDLAEIHKYWNIPLTSQMCLQLYSTCDESLHTSSNKNERENI